MPLKLMYITNNPLIASVAEKAGVDWIFVDLEYIGKEKRQKGLDTVKSHHTIKDVINIRSEIHESELLVRINPIHENSVNEINDVIVAGADIIMLPYFKSVEEVRFFLKTINGRCQTCLLLETPEAVGILDEIINLEGIDYIHIGLNDLHLGYKLNFMFELLVNGVVENICTKLSDTGIKYGFGGIAKIGEGSLPSNYIIPEHYRLKSEMVILSRTFYNSAVITSLDEVESVFNEGISKIRQFEKTVSVYTRNDFKENKIKIRTLVSNIVNEIGDL
ncbi:MAG: aldolase/citrate lyase family protein [Sphaerochaetaceae bacterium]|nr:aldolase/citrate lyase family protein [Sphaerochaetaceae bacterium]